MSEPFAFVNHNIPARIADLAFRIATPQDWNLVDLPADQVDFSEPGAFFPLMVAAAPWAAIVLTVAARPGFEDGTLQDWTLYLVDSLNIRPTALAPVAIGNVQGLVGAGMQEQEGTRLQVRFAFFEDGGRLVYLGLMAPEAISGSVEPVWKTAIQSFVLEEPKGQSVPVGPGLGFMPESAPEPPPPQPAAVEPEPQPEATPTAPQFTVEELGYYAKSDNSDTLDPEHPINARLRDQGVGFTPNLIEVDTDAKFAKLGAGSIAALIRVALGWHVIDDGKRTVVLDPAGKIQINLSLIATNGRDVNQIMDAIQAEAVQSYPNPEFLRLQDGDVWGLAIRNIAVNGEPVEQVHLLTKWARPTAMVRARVTSDPGSMEYAANYADLILRSAYYTLPDEEEEEAPEEKPRAKTENELPTSFTNEPEFVRNARKLERADRLQEMEQLIRNSIPSLHFAIALAELYRDRWVRLCDSNPQQAKEARKQAAGWARAYASFATSGGEGVALSAERDEFLRTLGPEPLE